MASMKEIALGITSVLPLPNTPNPLHIALWNEDAAEATALVKAVLAECHDAHIAMEKVRVPSNVWALLAESEVPMLMPPGTQIEVSTTLRDRIEFWLPLRRQASEDEPAP